MSDVTPAPTATPPLVERLVAHHREFLAFLTRRVGNRAVAEDLLQEAFVRGLAAGNELEHEEAAVGWFYRVLRNALVDYYRREASQNRRLLAFADELGTGALPDAELERVACRCVAELATTLKPEYAEALRRVEVDGVAVKDYAAETGVSAGNAAVRVFRARAALKKQVARACGSCADHGCLNCSCTPARAANET